jgi:NADH-quinone oxidoreductase subunit N
MNLNFFINLLNIKFSINSIVFLNYDFIIYYQYFFGGEAFIALLFLFCLCFIFILIELPIHIKAQQELLSLKKYIFNFDTITNRIFDLKKNFFFIRYEKNFLIFTSKTLIICFSFIILFIIFFFFDLLIFLTFFNEYIVSLKFFNRMLIFDQYTLNIKFILLVFSFYLLLLTFYYIKIQNNIEINIICFLIYLIIFLILLIHVINLALFFCILELITFCSYFILYNNIDSLFKTTITLKYFFINSFLSILFIFGLLLILIPTNATTNFFSLNFYLTELNDYSILTKMGIIFILFSILSKLGIGPLFFWVPNIYEGSSLYVLAFFSILLKVGLFMSFLRLLQIFFIISYLNEFIKNFLIFFSLISIIFGAFGALYEKKIKRILAYSSINNFGLILLLCALEEFDLVMFYIILYSFLLLGFFFILVKFAYILQKKKDFFFFKIQTNLFITDFFDLLKNEPFLCFMFSIILFSFIGMPPFIGFFFKYQVISILINSSYFIYVFICFFISCISSFYYLRFIKIMICDDIIKFIPNLYSLQIIQFFKKYNISFYFTDFYIICLSYLILLFIFIYFFLDFLFIYFNKLNLYLIIPYFII